MRKSWTIHDPSFDADLVHPMHAVYPWCGHRWFAYDLVRFLQPRTIAELGVHWGTSFFAFCQAVRDGSLDASIVGVDTWEGDGHTGPYGEEVIENVRRTIREHFSAQSIRLLRMTFDEALAEVEDDSQDVIHIDGFHTYEAVEHDFSTWLPKLAPDGVMMFHDVAEDTGYGSARFWRDMCEAHPGFAFGHSWGLGVLFPKGDTVLRKLKARNLSEKIKLYEYKGELELARRQNEDLSTMARERYEVLQRQKGVIEEAQQMARERYDAMKQQGERLANSERMARDRYEVMQQQGEKIERLKEHVRDRDDRLAEMREARQKQRDEIANLGRRLSNVQARERQFGEQAERRQQKIDELLKNLDARREAAREADAQIRQLRREGAEAAQRERTAVAALEQSQRRLEATRGLVEERLVRIKALHATVHERTARLRTLESRLEAARDTLERRDGRIERLTRTVAERDRLIAERDAMIEELRQRLDSIELDVELLHTRAGHAEDILATHRREIGALMKTEPGREAAEQLDSETDTRERIES